MLTRSDSAREGTSTPYAIQSRWRQISNPGAVSPDNWPCGNSREVANAVAICDRVLHSGNVSANATPVTVPSRQ